jgi:hypothetical protein
MADRSGGAAKRRRMKDDVDIKELNFGEDFEGAEAMLNAEVSHTPHHTTPHHTTPHHTTPHHTTPHHTHTRTLPAAQVCASTVSLRVGEGGMAASLHSIPPALNYRSHVW